MSSEGITLRVYFSCQAYMHTPPYFCHHVRNHLDREMAGRWIGRGGPIAWIPRSPDLTPLNFFLCDYVKNIVYQVKINDLQHLKALIRDTVATVIPNMLQAAWKEVEYRVDISCATNGTHIEIYLKLYTQKKALIVSFCNGVTHKCV
jgi:hypothetical protein